MCLSGKKMSQKGISLYVGLYVLVIAPQKESNSDLWGPLLVRNKKKIR